MAEIGNLRRVIVMTLTTGSVKLIADFECGCDNKMRGLTTVRVLSRECQVGGRMARLAGGLWIPELAVRAMATVPNPTDILRRAKSPEDHSLLDIWRVQ